MPLLNDADGRLQAKIEAALKGLLEIQLSALHTRVHQCRMEAFTSSGLEHELEEMISLTSGFAKEKKLFDHRHEIILPSYKESAAAVANYSQHSLQELRAEYQRRLLSAAPRQHGDGEDLVLIVEAATSVLRDGDREIEGAVNDLLRIASEEGIRVRAIKVALKMKMDTETSPLLLNAIKQQKDVILKRLKETVLMEKRQRCLDELREIGLDNDKDLEAVENALKKRQERSRERKKEQDRAVQQADLSLGKGSEESILFNVWDFGGQRIFQTVINMFLIRYGVVNLVFNFQLLVDLPNENTVDVKEAFAHLEHWLSTILTFVPNVPVILVGTHAGKEGLRDTKKHEQISSCLERRFGKWLERLVVVKNEAENLLYFPVELDVENSDPKDSNIRRLQKLIEETAAKDVVQKEGAAIDTGAAPYVNFETPLSWIRVAEQLRQLSLDGASYLGLSSSDDEADEEDTFVSICEEWGALEGCQNSGDIEKRIRVILALFHQFGVVWYGQLNEGSDNKFLREYVILKPQWVLEHITYIVRLVTFIGLW